MALDKQKILNELGSVVNQLQTADCGCLGKLFNNSSVYEGGAGNGNPQSNFGGCGAYNHGGCYGYKASHQAYGGNNPDHGHGCTAPCAGESCNVNRHCMGQCNPRRLYSDTYNFLSSNLMQPVVKEVYDDLKNINPTNTIMNSPIGTKMGMMQGTPEMRGDMGMNQNQMAMNQNPQGNAMGQYQTQNSMVYQQANDGNAGMSLTQMREGGIGNQMNMVNNKMGNMMGGMGPDIVKMMGGQSKPSYPHAQPANSMIGNVTQHTPGQAIASPMSPTERMNQGQHNAYANMNLGQTNPAVDMNQSRYHANAGINQQQYNVGATMNQQLANPTTQNMEKLSMASSFNPNANMQPGQGNSINQNYGQHTRGMSKFNEMFPGVANGELGFDPMAIAIQMNPANHQKAAIDQMSKMMNGNRVTPGLPSPVDSPQMKVAFPGAQVAASSITHNEQNVPLTNQTQDAINQGGQPAQQLQQPQQPQQLQQPQEPVTGDVTASGDVPVVQNQNSSELANVMIKEPIFPVDTSKFQTPSYMKRPKYYEYNTLGQPIEKLPAKLYHPSPESQMLPQTLSPQPTAKVRQDIARLHVRPTESKTSLMGIKPTRTTPSRSQLQHIYNQYKGSQSYTQQNIHNPVSPTTYSEGRLNRPQENIHQAPQAPVERVAGDTAANNLPMNNLIPVKGQPTEQIGDVTAIINTEQMLAKKGNCRNGLQDQTFPTYQGMSGWSFHGERTIPFSTGYRFRQRV